MRLRIEDSGSTALAVCGCGWRGLALTRHQALRRAADHERNVHPDDRHARALLAKTDREAARHAAEVAGTAQG